MYQEILGQWPHSLPPEKGDSSLRNTIKQLQKTELFKKEWLSFYELLSNKLVSNERTCMASSEHRQARFVFSAVLTCHQKPLVTVSQQYFSKKGGVVFLIAAKQKFPIPNTKAGQSLTPLGFPTECNARYESDMPRIAFSLL